MARVARALDRLYPLLSAAASSANPIPPGAEWMLDNHFVIRRALREVQTGLVRRFERRLPVVAEGPAAGAGRIELEAAAILRETDGLLDRAQLGRRIRAFALDHDLSVAELWALPLLLRLNLLKALAADGPKLLEQPLDSAVDHRVANGVRSLLLVQKTDWSRFFEDVSEVHRILCRDPSGRYARSDFETRDRYRSVVELLARRSRWSEARVASRALALASSALDDSALTGDVGYWLLGRGRAQLDRELGGLRGRLGAALRRRAALVYIGGIVFVALAHLVALVAGSSVAGVPPTRIAIAALLAVIPAWTIGVSLVNWLVTLMVTPTKLPKLDLSAGVPPSCRTLVVVPGLLIRERDAVALVDRIERHYLSFRDPNVEFAIASDFGDADEASVSADEALLEQARQGVAELNARYGDDDRSAPFHLFHRRRVWSPRQGRWMGWERKRGKLEELNRLLRGQHDTTYVLHEGRAVRDDEFRFVITLDADTILPPGAGLRLIETLAHPLNRACLDPLGQRVVSGYTVLQPRVEITPGPAPTRFAKLFAGDGAFDIYSRAVSDVYQDLFGEGVFVGKGIYDLDAFQASVEGKMPADRILSHDLIEGVHGRAGLVSDVIIYEDYPRNYLSHARRLHRWIRGDWQLLPWIGPRVPAADGRRRPNRLSAISRWKVLDNLRRSLLSTSLVGFSVFAWLALPGAWLWTALVVIVMATPVLADVGGGLLRARPGTLRPAISGVVGRAPPAVSRWLLRLALMVHDALVSCDAIARALGRTMLTKRWQLQWTPSAVAGRGAGSPRTIVREMAPATVLVLALAVGLLVSDPRAALGAAPLVLAWLSAPLLVIWTARSGRPASKFGPESESESESSIDEQEVRKLARRTWAYFERVVGPEDHWLPPDHFQEHPKGELAHRTSPTNIAMALLGTLAAYDLGYVALVELVVRLRNTIESLTRLPRHHGHVLNWCDTTTLAPLEPRYVSAVDSGNLAVALLILEQACRELGAEARPLERRFGGLRDSFEVLLSAVAKWGPEADGIRRRVEDMRDELVAIAGPRDWLDALDALDERSFLALDEELLGLFERESDARPPAAFEDLRAWATCTRSEVESLRSELTVQLPWLALVETVPAPTPAVLESTLEVLRVEFEAVPTLGQARAVYERVLALVEAPEIVESELPDPWRVWLEQLGAGLKVSLDHEAQLRARLEEIGARAAALVEGMDFGFLYDRDRELLYIGYDATAERYDEHHYDLLASEARLASIVGIAKGEVPLRHWAKLGRPIGRFGGGRGLLSWSGTMFEYLMPPLLLDEGEQTLLDVSARAAVRAQIEYGQRRGVPWGVSESGYSRLDSRRNYQYRAFGVPDIGFRRELERDLVIAPYASLIALRYAPAEVEANLARLDSAGAMGPLGAYEAVDYTRERLAIGQTHAVVRSYMSHHQGMILLALHGQCCARAMVARAHRHPTLRAVELLLREREPGRLPVERPQRPAEGPPAQVRVERVESWAVPPAAGIEAQLISNGRYAVLLTSGGAGHSRWRQRALTRPCQDPTLEEPGFVIELEDIDSGGRWSFYAGEVDDPCRETRFSAEGAKIVVHEHELVAELSVCVAIDEDAELRVVEISDRSDHRRRLSVTGYAEIVLDDARAYARHPAFSKLFVDSQVNAEPQMLVCRRRPREPDEEPLWLGCALVSDTVEWTGYETDRGAYLGRGGELGAPAGSVRELPRATTQMHATLDTCVALRGEVELSPGGGCSFAFVMFVAPSRAELLARADRLLSMAAVRRAQLEAERGALERAHERGDDTAALRRNQRLISAVLFPRTQLRAPAAVLARNIRGQPSLWRHGISGDWPIILVRVSSVGISAAADLVRAHSHWVERGVAVDLVLIEERAAGYGAAIRQRLAQVFEREGARIGAPDGGVFLVHGAALDEVERDLLDSCASVILDAELTDLETALDVPRVAPLPAFEPEGREHEPTPRLARPADLRLDNGRGGFSADGREYVIYLEPGQHTPAPWINVIANRSFGSVVSERGAGYTWADNAGLNRLSAWVNDPVLDPPPESLYVRDEQGGEVWSPVPAPAPAAAPYEVRHGAGYSTFTHHSHGLIQTVEVFVAPDDPVKFTCLSLVNCGQSQRRLTVTMCVEWLLGARAPADTRLLITEFDPSAEVALARNPWNPSFAGRCAFAAASEPLHGMTASREEFFGRRGSRRRPAALERIALSGDIVHGADACAALQVLVDLGPGEEAELHFMFGQCEDQAAAVELVERCRAKDVVASLRSELDRRWDRLLGAVEIRTPDAALDLLCNRWLLYQCISSRIWGRTGLYQSSGAFGFRDQLQDVLALVHAAPDLARAHILDAARRQYEAGDVQHWWHPPTGQGLRSRCSDDLLWLPLVTAAYVEATGDEALLDERAPYLDSAPLGPDEIERYEGGPRWTDDGTIYEHCLRALAHGGSAGDHGLPLIGSCDWNDGFSRVGVRGRGESVWLAWFFMVAATDFAVICDRVGELRDARLLRDRAKALIGPAEDAWDGAWYRRAYDDDGEPIGSETSSQGCQIDSLAQSWAVFSGRAPARRTRRAMAAVWDQLVARDEQLVRLFAPAFDGGRPRLGYIQAYPPGVRENGGQYTHAAVWVAWAFAELGDPDRAYDVLSMILPTTHARDPASVDRYRVEPHVIAADIYAEPPHLGRGGWTWYTGAAAWTYRLAVERILGVRRENGRVTLAPALPAGWPGFELVLREGEGEYRVQVVRLRRGVDGVAVVDGVERPLPIVLPALGREVREITIGVPSRAGLGADADSSEADTARRARRRRFRAPT
ncbi:GH36-type glycosyl hydrolase domain-containing protein [Enhygromyxa salina]|uniref:GH36-type glycosyl hydrolase domain-containing protein n=1 Tax=Enhygromyxa salina TaxID=215803 RepID=UPI000D093FA0|nr:glucoamylase family protein [Enhygromyxa salina]